MRRYDEEKVSRFIFFIKEYKPIFLNHDFKITHADPCRDSSLMARNCVGVFVHVLFFVIAALDLFFPPHPTLGMAHVC